MSPISMTVCYPYGRSIACVCRAHEQVVNCFPTLEMERRRSEQERLQGDSRSKVVDNNTEILLAATALVAVIALFLRYTLMQA